MMKLQPLLTGPLLVTLVLLAACTPPAAAGAGCHSCPRAAGLEAGLAR